MDRVPTYTPYSIDSELAAGVASGSGSGSGSTSADPSTLGRTTSQDAGQPSTTPSTKSTAKSTPDDSDSSKGGGGGAGQPPKVNNACNMCRLRKVRCDRTWPVCTRCKERGEECSFGDLVPSSAIPDFKEETRIAALEARLAELERHLVMPVATDTEPDEIRHPPIANVIYEMLAMGVNEPTTFYSFLRDVYREMSGTSYASMDMQLATPQLGTALIRHLIQTFRRSCCGYLPAFAAFHDSYEYYESKHDKLPGTDQAAVSVFAAMGARASPHSQLLGMPHVDPLASPYRTWIDNVAAGARRELACVKLQRNAVEMCKRYELTDLPSVQNTQILIASAQMLFFSEVEPKLARTMIRLAYGHWKDMLFSDMADDAKRQLCETYAFPLITLDAEIAAYGLRPCVITESDLKDCFENTAVRLPDFSFNALRDIIDGDFFDRNLLDHNSITSATEKLVCWLCACHREVARITTIVKPQDLEAEVYRLYTVGLDELHSVLRQLQKGLVELGYTPVGCGVEDGCPNLHIRYVTRLDFEALNVAVLMHSHLRKYLSIRGDDPSFREMLRESERRVRRSLKLAPFYMMAYAAGEDPHMSYHICWQLERLPDWLEMSLQRFGETPGPETRELELTEHELDWLYKGLVAASFYCVPASVRLREYIARKRPSPADETPSVWNPQGFDS